MKLQNLTVIFAVIIIPITLILSGYIGTQIDTASLQQSYDTTLMDATHDAVMAFELNTENDNYSTNADSIRRDIDAAINTFTTSLTKGLGIPGSNSEAVMPYVPAILITLYDGYYIYSPAKYQYPSKEVQADGTMVDITKTGYTHMLKPYVYYTAKYVSGNNYVIVNYSLDNYITVYGLIGTTQIAKSGYLETSEILSYISSSGENLSEDIMYQDDNENLVMRKNTKYIYQNGQKLYNINGTWYYLNGLKRVKYSGNVASSSDTSAIKYKDEVNSFKDYLTKNIGGTSIMNIVTPKNCEEIQSNDTTQLLNTDPEDQASVFNQHKRQIIRQSIQNNLNNAMAIYNKNSASMGTNAEFEMPKLSEEDWEKIITNVNIVTFMQGLQVGGKIYNNYAIVTSSNNKQYIEPNSIYFVDSVNGKYHTIYDTEVQNNIGSVTGYKAQDFRKVKYEYSLSDETKVVKYYYKRPEYACYNCVISANTGETRTLQEILSNTTISQKYYTALARERYNLIKVTSNL